MVSMMGIVGRFVMGWASVLVLSACAVSTAGGGLLGGDRVQGDKVAECGSAGAPSAQIDYPPGWFERIAAAEKRTAPVDELLGGVGGSAANGSEKGSTVLGRLTLKADSDEGLCEVLFDTNAQGAPVNMLTACSSGRLLEAARLAAQDARVAPRIEDGQAVGRKSVVYPVLFCRQ